MDFTLLTSRIWCSCMVGTRVGVGEVIDKRNSIKKNSCSCQIALADSSLESRCVAESNTLYNSISTWVALSPLCHQTPHLYMLICGVKL